MRKLILFLVLGLAMRSQAAEWLTDFEAAKEKARQENKSVLLDFTGSDWCPWCMRLKAEVFDQPEFATFAQANLILVEVDFPRQKQLDQNQKEANQRLAETFNIHGFPTVILVNGNGQLLGRDGYEPGGAAAYNARLARILFYDKTKTPSDQPATDAPDAPTKQRPSKPLTFAPVPPTVPIHYGALALKGISGPKNRRMVLINNATLMEGESAHVKSEDHDVLVVCKEIRDDSVVITADDNPMVLKLSHK